MINEVFNENRSLRRIELIQKSDSLYILRVFVAHRDLRDGNNKNQPIIDIRPLNDMVAYNVYPIPRQEDVIQALARADYISTFDVTSSFYQRLIHSDNRYYTGIIAHSSHGYEQFAMAPMGYKYSIGYNQKFYDQLFKGLSWRIVCVYIDDIVIYSKTFTQHLRDLDKVLSLLENAGITLRAKKAYVGY